MINNLKVLGLALVAMLALGATSASAAEFHSESASTTVTGSQSTTNTFTTDSGTVHCSTATFTGSQSGTTATAVKVTPTYTGCKSTGFIEANVTVDTNGCHYNITADGQVHLEECEAGKSGIVVTAPFCTITVTSGQTLNSVSFANTGSGTTQEVTVTANVNNIAYHESGGLCKNSGSSTTGGTYGGSVKVTGETGSPAVHTGIWWT